MVLLALAAYLGGSAALAWRVTRPIHRPITETPARYDMPVYESVSFVAADGTRLYGWYVPADHPHGAAIMCHGIDGDRTSLLTVARMLHGHGYASLLFDFRARGASEGSQCTLGYREVDDLTAARQWLAGRKDLAGLRVAVVGHSLGAAVALMCAGHRPDIAAVVAESPFATLDNAVANYFRLAFGPPGPLLGTPTRWFGERLIGARCSDVCPVSAIAKIAPRPVLLIQDGADRLCPPSETRELLAASRGRASLWTVPGAGHVEAPFVAPVEYERRVVGFLDNALRQDPPPSTP